MTNVPSSSTVEHRRRISGKCRSSLTEGRSCHGQPPEVLRLGREGEGLDEAERAARVPLRRREARRRAARRRAAASLRDHAARAAHLAARLARARAHARSATNGCCTPTASPTPRPCAPSPATSPTRRTSSRCPRPKPTSPPCSTGRAARSVAVVPFGAGSSVVGGVEPVVGDAYAGAVSLDMRRLDRVLEVDATSRAARIQAGILGPAIEAALKPHGFALRHYPQSFEFSTLGGWIATRSGGHFATLYTHIDDLVESLRTVTPAGVMESRRLPGSGAGPSPDRMMIGSEGALGVITEAWMRLQGRPRFRADAVFGFPDLFAAARAVRAARRPGSIRRTCASSTTTKRAPTASTPTRRACSCSPSNPPTIRSTPGWRARSSSCRTMAGAATPTRPRACAGAPPSSACPMRAS